ncbi:MAG: hypothetical protein ABSB35_21605 [Bryobacteraceae bacterium]|jgi:hypothetical protein
MLETTQAEAVLLLRKWQEEKTLIQASLSFDQTRCIVLGRVERIDGDEVQIDGSSRDDLGGQYGLVVRFANVRRFCFGDMDHIPQPRQPEIQQAVGAFETHLLLDLGACLCVIFAIRDSRVHQP